MRPQLPEGHTVRYRHTRRMIALDKMDAYPELSAKGGETEAKVYGPDDSVVAIGTATCHPRDNFNKRIARDIALGRALKQLAKHGPYQVGGRTGPVRISTVGQGSTWDTYDQNPPAAQGEGAGA